MIQVTELGYMGIDVSDLDAWKQYARDLLALEVVDEAEGDRCYGLLAPSAGSPCEGS